MKQISGDGSAAVQSLYFNDTKSSDTLVILLQ